MCLAGPIWPQRPKSHDKAQTQYWNYNQGILIVPDLLFSYILFII